MALAEFMYGDPADVVYIQQLAEIKHTQGCMACVLKGQVVLGRSLCSIPGNEPGRRGFCKKWRHDEGVGDVANHTND